MSWTEIGLLDWNYNIAACVAIMISRTFNPNLGKKTLFHVFVPFLAIALFAVSNKLLKKIA